MTILKFPSQQPSPPFFEDVINDGYHIFNLKNAKIPDYYPNEFPNYPGVSLNDLKIGDKITIRVFFRVGFGKDIRADGGYIDLEVEHIENDHILRWYLLNYQKNFLWQQGILSNFMRKKSCTKQRQQTTKNRLAVSCQKNDKPLWYC